MKATLRLCVALALHAGGLVAFDCRAEGTQLRVARQYGIGYLQMMVMEYQHLIEQQAKAQGLDDVRVTWRTFGDGTVANDAILSGDIDFAAGGLGSFVTLWDRTRGTLAVKGVAALNSMPMLLNTRNPNIKTIRDLTDEDRIAIPGVKVSSQATTLQFAAAQTFGAEHWSRLDALTVNMTHPTGMQAMLQERSGITAHFASPPFQYQELDRPGVRTVLNSYAVWGGPQTFIAAWTTSRFRADNPRLYAAFLSALREATDFINRDRRSAAAIYLKMTNDKGLSIDALVAMLMVPEMRFTLTPENVVKFVSFKARIGAVKARAESWKDLFFPEIHALPGS